MTLFILQALMLMVSMAVIIKLNKTLGFFLLTLTLISVIGLMHFLMFIGAIIGIAALFVLLLLFYVYLCFSTIKSNNMGD